MGKFDNLYARLPVPSQHAAVSLYGMYWRYLRFGPGYSQYVNEYKARENFTRSQWDQWQTAQLRSLLRSCATHVPYYREHWDAKAHKAALDGDLQALPLLDKEPLRATPQAFLREDQHPLNAQVFFTSGSTGTPISCYYTVPELRRSLALRQVRSARWAGVSFTLPRATFSGRLVEPDPESKGRSEEHTSELQS